MPEDEVDLAQSHMTKYDEHGAEWEHGESTVSPGLGPGTTAYISETREEFILIFA
jgi:hypothetical protein